MATSGLLRSSCNARIRVCSANARTPEPAGPSRCGFRGETSAYFDPTQPATVNRRAAARRFARGAQNFTYRTLPHCFPSGNARTSFAGTLVRCKHVGLHHWFSDNSVVCDYDGCAGFQFVSQLVGKLGTESQSGGQGVCTDRLTFAGHPLPPRFFAIRRETAGLSGCSFEHREHMIPEFVAPSQAFAANKNGGGSDRIAVAIHIHCQIG